ncbi:MAG: aldo/keto reductase [Vulcanococcus sp.]
MANAAGQPGIGVGTWAWGNQFLWGYDPARDDDTLAATFRRCLERGLLFFDTADSYGTGRFNGRSEQLLGRFAMAASPEQRSRLCIATKLAPFPWRLGRHGYDRAFAASQARLQGQMKRVQLHWSTARYAPWQEGPLLDGLADQVQVGAVQSLGVSNMGPRRLREVTARLAERGVPLASLQVQLSLLSPEAVQPGGVAEVCRELGIALIAYSPLALGLLSRGPEDSRPLPAGPRGALFRRLEPQLQPLRQAMAELAEGRPGGLAAVALNWCRAHGAMPIPGLRNPDQVERGAESLRWTLSDPERQRLDALAFAAGAPRMPANPFQSA